MIKAIFTDLDGVIRHWNNRIVDDIEVRYHLPIGILFDHAFKSELLLPTITGKQTHSDWLLRTEASLAGDLNASIANLLIDTWQASTFSIDFSLIDLYREILPLAKLILVTNATDRLSEDLIVSNLTGLFDLVVNSSEIGYAKPDIQFYNTALSLSGVEPREALFIDDSVKNTEAAKTLGFETIVFNNRTQATEELKKVIRRKELKNRTIYT